MFTNSGRLDSYLSSESQGYCYSHYSNEEEYKGNITIQKVWFTDMDCEFIRGSVFWVAENDDVRFVGKTRAEVVAATNRWLKSQEN